MYLIPAEWYKNAGVYFLKIRKTGEIWPRMKDVGSNMAVKNISDLVLKEIYDYKQKIIQFIRRTKFILVLPTFRLIQQSRTKCSVKSLHSVSKLLSNGT